MEEVITEQGQNGLHGLGLEDAAEQNQTGSRLLNSFVRDAQSQTAHHHDNQIQDDLMLEF